jgi:hypothetical protein
VPVGRAALDTIIYRRGKDPSVGVLQKFERRLEGLVEGTFARVFKGEVQPVEIASALQRETDDKRAVVSQGRVLVPNDFVVELSAHDHERLEPYAQPLTSELAEMVKEHAADNGYTFVGRVQVAFELTEDLDTGTFRVRSGVTAGARPSGGVISGGEYPASSVQAAGPPPAGVLPGAPHFVISRGEQIEAGSPQSRGEEEVYFLTQPDTVIGRGADAQLQLNDPRVSRRHAVISFQEGAFVLTDLDSTNGTLVNDTPVSKRQLVNGDRVGVGTMTLLFRQHLEQ